MDQENVQAGGRLEQLPNIVHLAWPWTTRVPLLILNACRSADSEPPEQPGQVNDLHQQIRQFGSFAQ